MSLNDQTVDPNVIQGDDLDESEYTDPNEGSPEVPPNEVQDVFEEFRVEPAPAQVPPANLSTGEVPPAAVPPPAAAAVTTQEVPPSGSTLQPGEVPEWVKQYIHSVVSGAPTPESEPGTPPVEPPPPMAAPDPEARRKGFLEHREKTRKQIEEAIYKGFTDEDVVAFQEDPRRKLAEMASHLRLDVYDSVMTALERYLPYQVGQHIATVKEQEKHTKRFFDRWPMLDQPEYEPYVRYAGVLYRQANPKFDIDQFIEAVGPAALMTIAQAASKGLVKLPKGFDNSVPVSASGGSGTRRPIAFRPARAGASKSRFGQAPNDWERLSREWEKE